MGSISQILETYFILTVQQKSLQVMLVELSTTLSTKVPGISSEVAVLGLSRFLSLTLLVLALPLFPMLPSIAPNQKSSLVSLSC